MRVMTDLDQAPFAVLVSGGLDSAVLLGTALDSHSAVYPLYIRSGLSWEGIEQEYLGRFLAKLSGPSLNPLVTLELPVTDVYGEHWSLTGRDEPGAESPDEAVYLQERNV